MRFLKRVFTEPLIEIGIDQYLKYILKSKEGSNILRKDFRLHSFVLILEFVISKRPIGKGG